VDVQRRRRGLAAQLAELGAQGLLVLDSDVLSAEEDGTTLGDWM
jgi:hypothetical protein